MTEVLLWVKRPNKTNMLLQDVIESLYFMDPDADIDVADPPRYWRNDRYPMYIHTTERAVAYCYGGLVAAGGVYVERGKGHGLISIAKWTPQGEHIKLRLRYLHRPGGEESGLSAAYPTISARRARLSPTDETDRSARRDRRDPQTRADRQKSYRELADDSDIHNE
jgi:hypothetical protein